MKESSRESMMQPADEELASYATKIVDFADSHGVTLRILGSLAVWVHSQERRTLFRQLERLGTGKNLFTDIDLVGYRKQRMQIRNMFEKQLAIRVDQQALLYYGDSRLICRGTLSHPYQIDVFMDRLDYSHTVDFGNGPENGRLKLDSPTIDLADLMLEKLQIHDITEKDIKDLVVVLLAHEIGGPDQSDMIDGMHIAAVLAGDWGFWYDAKINLDKLNNTALKYASEEKISIEDQRLLNNRIGNLNRIVDETPKTKDWEKRARKGAKDHWWKDIEERTR
jgi:hypothetical protein